MLALDILQFLFKEVKVLINNGLCDHENMVVKFLIEDIY